MTIEGKNGPSAPNIVPIYRVALAATTMGFHRKHPSTDDILRGTCPLHGITYAGHCWIEIDQVENTFKTGCVYQGKNIQLASLFVFKKDKPDPKASDMNELQAVSAWICALPAIETFESDQVVHYFASTAPLSFEECFPNLMTTWTRTRFTKAATWWANRPQPQPTVVQPPTVSTDSTTEPLELSEATKAMLVLFRQTQPDIDEKMTLFLRAVYDPTEWARAYGGYLLSLAMSIVRERQG